MANFAAPSGSWTPSDEPRHQDGAAVEVGYRVVDREPLGRIALPLKEAEDRGVALHPGLRPGGRERTSDPGPPSLRSIRNT